MALVFLAQFFSPVVLVQGVLLRGALRRSTVACLSADSDHGPDTQDRGNGVARKSPCLQYIHKGL